jgi:hypothetical protein
MSNDILSKLLSSNDTPAPCSRCGSCFRWLDVYGTHHCKGCSPPSRLLVRQIETLINWPDSPGWEITWIAAPIDDLPPYHDPWHDGKAPDGWKLAIGSRVAYEPCRHSESVAIPCRNGEWLRIECARCHRVLDLRDNDTPWIEF